MDLLLGFRQVTLDESLSITENLVTTTALPIPNTTPTAFLPAGTTFLVNDKFSTYNRFYGGQVGLAGEWRLGDWSLGYFSKVAVGTTEQVVKISGSTTQGGAS